MDTRIREEFILKTKMLCSRSIKKEQVSANPNHMKMILAVMLLHSIVQVPK